MEVEREDKKKWCNSGACEGQEATQTRVVGREQSGQVS